MPGFPSQWELLSVWVFALQEQSAWALTDKTDSTCCKQGLLEEVEESTTADREIYDS
jgi:hypothetical protein